MPVFEYLALSPQGKKLKGLRDADSASDLRQLLRKEGVYPTDIRLSKSTDKGSATAISFSFSKIDHREVIEFTRQLSTLIGAHVPVVEAIAIVGEEVESPRFRKIIFDIREMVSEGQGLSDALGAYPKVFPDLYVGMVSAGECGSELGVILSRLADFLEQQQNLRSKVDSSLAYPKFLMIFALLVVYLMLTLIVPKITEIFSDMASTLPAPTRALLSLSRAIDLYWWVFLLTGGLMWAGFKYFAHSAAGRERLDLLKLHIPIFGELNRKAAVSRFTRTLSTLLAGGLHLMPALAIVAKVVDNTILKNAIESARNNIGEGHDIATPLARTGVFPKLVTHMISIGEKSGELEEMLTRIANSYDREVERAIDKMTSILQPLLIIILGGVIMAIVAAIMLPLLEMNTMAGR